MQLGNFIDVFLARHVSGTTRPSSGALDVGYVNSVRQLKENGKR